MTERPTAGPGPIETIAELHSHLQTAIELEHATIPAYLTALYSIRDGSNPEAVAAIRGVVVEEMLHLTLAANILNAVGGQPCINGSQFVPSYPTTLPHSAARVVVSIEKFSRQAIDTFMQIEHPPDIPHPPPQADQYQTIGQFYNAIRDGIARLVDRQGVESVFSGQLSRQVQPRHYYGSGGHIHVVTCPQSAELAIREIIDQGEGADDGHKVWEEPLHPDHNRPRGQAAHYYRFQEVLLERLYRKGDAPGHPLGDSFDVDYAAVWPIGANPRADEFEPGSPLRAAVDGFNRRYKDFLNLLHRAFNGEPDLVAESVPMMYQLKYLAQELMALPRPDGRGNVGPTWEWVAD